MPKDIYTKQFCFISKEKLAMSTEYPRQVDFVVKSEEWGKVLLADKTVVEVRFILQDLILESEDILGAKVSLSPLVAVRCKASQALKEAMKEKPLAPETPLPATPEAGFEVIGVEQIEKPAVSAYVFDSSSLTITMDIQTVARNLRYKLPNGSPVYSVRWRILTKIEKSTAK
jgi:hypothetical protein